MYLALREIRAAKVRFGLLAGAVGLLIFLILFQQAILRGLITSFVGALENQDAQVLVFGEQARRNVEASRVLPAQVAAVAEVDGVARTGPIGENTFTVRAGGELRDGVLFGYQLGGLGEPQTLSDGRLPQGPNEGVASSADEGKGFAVGDVVEIVGPGGPAITIVGVGEDLRWSVSPTVFVSYDTFEAAVRAVQPNSDVVLPSLVAAEPEPGLSPSELAGRITAAVAGVEALDLDTAVAESPGVAGVNQSFRIILALAFVVIALVVGFFFLILTVQKSRSLVLLRAVGSPTGYLVRGLMAQIVVVFLAAVLLALLMFAVVRAAGVTGDVGLSLPPETTLVTVAVLGGLALFAGVASLRRVFRIEPVRATQPGRI